MDRKPNLGKRLAVGQSFRTTTKTMNKFRGTSPVWPIKERVTYEVLKPGHRAYFTKGKRRYYCEVMALVELRTGYNNYLQGNEVWKGPRWWQFTYLVKILEN